MIDAVFYGILHGRKYDALDIVVLRQAAAADHLAKVFLRRIRAAELFDPASDQARGRTLRDRANGSDAKRATSTKEYFGDYAVPRNSRHSATGGYDNRSGNKAQRHQNTLRRILGHAPPTDNYRRQTVNRRTALVQRRRLSAKRSLNGQP